MGRDEHLIDGYVPTQVHTYMDDLLHPDSSPGQMLTSPTNGQQHCNAGLLLQLMEASSITT